ncbi:MULTISPECIES: secondary thiamine-phosphate synthase enzyme YjbQ [unclassified Wenzhouxiangella]|uniref:secondary thiamine-phosphate synthase enzyme YjbQ n=1 Tax=unclassified Wenzhouxiangella TaxID=2613841 RepID=UPI000E32980A|nr:MULTISPECIES: secondary thiamine-phosphate synthase enzyme YjbQ [unclassified Wenzhouxiangella]RFF27767.1 YjbQ family protein [Wenzhouxiangella sp. 15181]RFP68396.1 YjbQ family protein [Wenzhouxiangella sp. 15190]
MYQSELTIETAGRDTLDVTDRVAGEVAASGIETGLCHVFLKHTSASLLINENADPDVQRDLETFFADLVPDGDARFRHDAEGADDMAAHVRLALTHTDLTIPVAAGRLALGTWQGIFLWEHRYQPHRRHIVVTIR